MPAKKSTKKTTVAKKEVVETAPAVEETTEVTVTPTVEDAVTTEFSQFAANLQALHSTLASLKTQFRNLEKTYSRELKQARKEGAKRKRKTGNRSPSGFVKPTLISNELATFLGREQGSVMARTEVTREINAYVRKHSLQDPSNGRKINPDKKLSSLLKIKKGDELTYFNLQRYMSPHFAKQNQTLADINP